MKKLFWLLSSFIMTVGLVMSVVALTDHNPDNPLTKYRLLIVIANLAIAGFIGFAYRKLYKE